MKIKVIHLLRRTERIDRDLEELDRLRATIQEDRDYADRVRDSLQDESRRLSELREKILAQVIKNPPEMTTAARPPLAVPEAVVEAAPPADSLATPAPEIIVPGRKTRSAAATTRKSGKTPTPAPNKSAGRKKSESKKPAAPFQFRYN